MEFNFDDGLSEDWISQPRSSDFSVAPDHPASFRRSTNSSRIPLPKSASTSSLPRRLSDRPLLEKTASALNVKNAQHFSKSSTRDDLRKNGALSDIEETGSVRKGIVQHKESGRKGVAPQGTPEWKRRLLDGRGGNSKQKGLFSPIGLENVFRPPTLRKDVATRSDKARLYAPPNSVPPSSPPIVPSRSLQSLDIQSPNESFQLPKLPPFRKTSFGNRRVSSRSGRRSLSGKSYLQHESFSPVNLKPINAPKAEMQQSLRESLMRRQGSKQLEVSRPGSSLSDSVLDIGGYETIGQNLQALPDLTSTSLPDELDPKPGPYAFVTMKRGGVSSEASFQRRPLSPSSFQPASTPSFPLPPSGVSETHSAPKTAHATRKSESENSPDEQLEHSVGNSPTKLSPLKLFDNYDTFTNDRLSRRISQFEIGGKAPSSQDDLIEDFEFSTPSPRREQVANKQRQNLNDRRISSFGDGVLDRYNFAQEKQLPEWPTNKYHGRQSKATISNSGELGIAQKVSKTSETQTQLTIFVEQQLDRGPSNDVNETQQVTEGKRLRSSPQKVPHAKRRRTINEQDENESQIYVGRQRPPLSHNSSVAGKKRKDARYDHTSQTADPEVIATRHMLHPRVRQQGLSQKSRNELGAGTVATTVEDNEEPLLDLEAATGVLAGELANLAVNVAEGISNGARKKSVTTADFFREANLIMQHIRSNAIQRESGLDALAADLSRLPGIEESTADMFSSDNFSRPPSREGGSPSKRVSPGPKEIRVISRLRKFEDTDDIGLALNSSFQGLQERKSDGPPSLESLESEPSNIRILDPPRNEFQPDKAEKQNVGECGDGEKTHETENYLSSKSSSRRSAQTGSSGTHTKAVIAPDKVSHLLSDQMGRMTFDYEQRRWVKKKPSKDQLASADRLGSEATEDDPLRDIPDLDVDESQELRNIRTTRTSSLDDRKTGTTASSGSNRHIESQDTQAGQVKVTIGSPAQPAPTGSIIDTSEAIQQRRNKISHDREADLEAALSQGAVAEAPGQANGRRNQARAVTVTFSSPLVQTATIGPVETWDGSSELGLNVDDFTQTKPAVTGKAQEGPKESLKIKQPLAGKTWSSVRQLRTSRALSRIEEGEQSPSPPRSVDVNSADMAITFATPQVAIKDSKASVLVPSTAKSYATMQLTPLPDFTVHHADESMNLDVQYVAKRRGLASIQEVEGKFSLSIKDLVEKIADVEPYEPYWEHMKDLKLRNRGLLTLHMLDDFCSRIEELDVAGNELGQLNGAPQTLRVLEAPDNCLSSLTAWGHLQNLQYLDLRDNEIDNLAGFRELIHLRELNVEGNQIESLEGILHLNGLLKLKVGRNCLNTLELHECDLHRLTELDLHSNKITDVKNLEQLPALERLDLRKNKLIELNFEGVEQTWPLKFLDVSENGLKSLDVSRLTNISDLLLDSNHVVQLSGADKWSNAQNISWRTQGLPRSSVEKGESSLNLGSCLDARSLSLSGTPLLSFDPPKLFVGLSYLDLASCGLVSLPDDFGMLVPSVRHLNLNYNALKDLKPLSGIERLVELHVAGNRIVRFRRAMESISNIGDHLHTLDCRNNPFTSGFYLAPHLGTLSQVSTTKEEDTLQTTGAADSFNRSAYIVPDASSSDDADYLQRLDFSTRIRRRVYELMLVKFSRRLEKLDGIAVDSKRILVQDGVWERLLDLGVVQPRVPRVDGDD